MRQALLFCTAALLVGQPAHSYQIIPSAFANAFCLARQKGAGMSESIEFGVRMSIDFTKPDSPKVNGVGVDATEAARAANAYCPEHFTDKWY